MKICILTPRFPFPENGGDVLRINNIARYLKSKKHELILISFSENNCKLLEEYYKIYDKIYTIKRTKINSLFMSLFFVLLGKPIQCGYYFSFSFLKKFKEIIKIDNPDIYISHLLRMVPYLEHTKQRNKSIIEMTDALSKTYSLSSNAKGNNIKKVIYKFERGLIQRYEKHVITKYQKIVLVSNTDAEYLNSKNTSTNKSLIVYTNGVDCCDVLAEAYDKNKICFIGNMRTLQNQDAVVHFVKDIFPIIKEKNPNVVFTIIGAQPPENIQALADNKNIIVTGFVDDIQKVVSDCCLAVAPVRIAAGIQNKVLVAMGCGVPVVMSSLISTAIPELVSGKNCFIEDDDKVFAEKCIKLMNNHENRTMISKNGWETVKKHYSWNEKLEGYEIIK